MQHCETCTCEAKPEPMTRDEEAMAIIAAVARHYGVKPEKMWGSSRKIQYVEPRHDAMLMLRNAGYLLKEIGMYLDKDHSTVIHGIRCAEQRRIGRRNHAKYRRVS